MENGPFLPGEGRQTILIADDEEMLRRMYKLLAEQMGYRTILACDGAEALELFRSRQEEIHLILLDYCMPEMDGLVTFQELKKIQPDVKVILSSGYDREESCRHFAEKGIAGFLQKPFTREDLHTVIQECLKMGSPS